MSTLDIYTKSKKAYLHGREDTLKKHMQPQPTRLAIESRSRVTKKPSVGVVER